MAGQQTRPLNGQFNRVPVLHSNQPEEVEGPGILINTAPGSAFSPENGQVLRNAEFTFNGDFGVHMHHKYFPPYRAQIARDSRRSELTIGLILINPSNRPVHIRFHSGAVRNSFEAPYLANSMAGVRPLGPRPWNTGPGDATAIQLLRGRLDSKLSDEITVPPRSRVVLFDKDVPALGIANALLRGRSDGPFQMAVVAASRPRSEADLLAVLDQGRLAPGRVYLRRISDIESRQIFSRVGGVALGDSYQAKLSHNLELNGPLHVPLTSTDRHHFGTKEIQVNPLASRMVDSSLDNVGTYGVRFDIDLNLRGTGLHELVLSHPVAPGSKPFTAFRGSLEIRTPEGQRDVHVVLRSGQSLSLAELDLKPGADNPVRVSLVYPADATPGHLLSVVPSTQLSLLKEQERRIEIAKAEAERLARSQSRATSKGKSAKRGAVAAKTDAANLPVLPPLPSEPVEGQQLGMQQPTVPPPIQPAFTLPANPDSPALAPVVMPPPVSQTLIDRYQQALEAQQLMMRDLMSR
ncbi:MAG: DUF3370 family protein [Cyanobacteria bacterium K_DeepCast_35m_m2_023]|nr:DUF3370 family protein [Cyanobacteria bacterium K_DeepCast_35m_m2_023]